MTPDPTPLSLEALASLKEKAEAATPGPWFREGAPYYNQERWVTVSAPDGQIAAMGGPVREDIATQQRELADAEFIAAANPSTVLSLISELERRRGLEQYAEHAHEFIASLYPRTAHEANAQAGLGTMYAALAPKPSPEQVKP